MIGCQIRRWKFVEIRDDWRSLAPFQSKKQRTKGERAKRSEE